MVIWRLFYELQTIWFHPRRVLASMNQSKNLLQFIFRTFHVCRSKVHKLNQTTQSFLKLFLVYLPSTTSNNKQICQYEVTNIRRWLYIHWLVSISIHFSVEQSYEGFKLFQPASVQKLLAFWTTCYRTATVDTFVSASNNFVSPLSFPDRFLSRYSPCTLTRLRS